ncbi:MAG TPA: hypothetical protein GX699_05985 [Firmicutes bacterium]|nr:hypothetical protein [Bacillota bacterium]
MAQFLYLVISLADALLAAPLWAELACLAGHLAPNYRGKAIPQSMGTIFLPVFLPAAAWAHATELLAPHMLWRTLLIVFAFGLLGLADDIWGNPRAKGFSGHFTRLLREGSVTTGLLKAVAGYFAALAAVSGLPAFFPLPFLRAALVALSANLLNLLDLRPGRSLKAFFLLALLLVLLVPKDAGALLLLPFLLAAFILFPRDLAGGGMLGDAGANVLGAVLGLYAVLFGGNLLQLASLAILAVVHVLTEKVSLSAVIDRQPLLRFLDHLGRTGQAE